MKNLSYKDKLINTKQVSIINKKTGKIIWTSPVQFPQHYYPLTALDYCEAVKRAIKYGIDQSPILSVSSKDYPYCDFACKECLACPSREWAIKNNNIKYPIIPIDKYKKILDEISTYSVKRGFNSVRFEICGEGNPDLYKDRIEMIKYASQKCGMGIVYVSTGSRLTEKMIDCLIENASFIRISFPGISDESYKYYSNQDCNKMQFKYNDAIELLNTLCKKRKEANREDSLLIGVRTCIRPLNAGHYNEFIRTISNIGVDVFQGVKVLTPNFQSVKNEEISKEVVEELLQLKESAYDYGIKDFQLPNDLDTIYRNRSITENDKSPICWSSIVSPLLYGTNLICCVLWDKIKDLNYHYGILEGNKNELEEFMQGKKAKFIMKNCPKNCSECCALEDNSFMNSLWNILKQQDNVDDIEFIIN